MTQVYLREVHAGTPNAGWTVCARGDPGAVAFAPVPPSPSELAQALHAVVDAWEALHTTVQPALYAEQVRALEQQLQHAVDAARHVLHRRRPDGSAP